MATESVADAMRRRFPGATFHKPSLNRDWPGQWYELCSRCGAKRPILRMRQGVITAYGPWHLGKKHKPTCPVKEA